METKRTPAPPPDPASSDPTQYPLYVTAAELTHLQSATLSELQTWRKIADRKKGDPQLIADAQGACDGLAALLVKLDIARKNAQAFAGLRSMHSALEHCAPGT